MNSVRLSLLTAAGFAALTLPATAQALPPEYELFFSMMDLVTEGANVAGAAIATSAVNSPFSPSTAGVSYDVEADTCGMSPWSRANAESITVNVSGVSGTARFGTGIAGIDYACTNIGGTGLDVAGGVYGGATTGVVTSPDFPTVTFDIRQWLVGAYGSFSKGNFAGNLKVQHGEEDYVGSGFNLVPGLPVGTVPEGSSISLSRTSISGAASYAWEAMDNVFLIPIVGFDIAHLRPDPIQFGGDFVFTPQNSTAALIYGGLTLAHTIVLPDGMSAIVPFVSGTYYADVGDGITGTVTGTLPAPGGPIAVPVTGASDMSYAEIGGGFNFVTILDDGSGDAALKQMTFGLRGYYKWNAGMKGWGGAGSIRLQF
jgi:hypothetical protein